MQLEKEEEGIQSGQGGAHLGGGWGQEGDKEKSIAESVGAGEGTVSDPRRCAHSESAQILPQEADRSLSRGTFPWWKCTGSVIEREVGRERQGRQGEEED